MHISKGEFLALIFVLWENHARRTRKVQIIKMQKVERLDPGLNLPVLMPFNPLKGLDDPGGELFVCNGLPQGYVVCSASTHFVPQNKVRFYTQIQCCKQAQQSTQPKHRPTTVHTNGQRERRGTGLSSSSFLLFFFKYFLYF